MKTSGEYQLVSITLCPAREARQTVQKKKEKKKIFDYRQVWMDLNSMQNNCTKSDKYFRL